MPSKTRLKSEIERELMILRDGIIYEGFDHPDKIIDRQKKRMIRMKNKNTYKPIERTTVDQLKKLNSFREISDKALGL